MCSAARLCSIPGLTGAILAVVLFQIYLLLDCVDGEVARWRKQTSITGVYLDRVGHYLCEAALLVGFGLRGADLFGTGAVRLAVGLPRHARGARRHPDQGGDRPGRRGPPPAAGCRRSRTRLRAALLRLALARRAAAALKFHRLVGGIEARLFILVVAVLDAVQGDLFFTRLGIAVLAGIAVVQTLLHLVSILASSRLR